VPELGDTVPREIVLAALKANNVDIVDHIACSQSARSQRPALKANNVDIVDHGDGLFTFAKGDRIETTVLLDEVGKKLLFGLQFHYGVPMHWFFNPSLIPGWKAN
jgi:hypothetical protein